MDVSPAEKRDGKPEKDFPPHILISVSRERRRREEERRGWRSTIWIGYIPNPFNRDRCSTLHNPEDRWSTDKAVGPEAGD